MPLGCGQVDQAAFAQQIDLASVFQGVLFDEVARGALRGGELFESGDVDLDVEVARVRDDRAIFHQFEVFLGQHALVAGHGAEHIAEFGGFCHGHDTETVHHSFERLRRIDFGDDDFGALRHERGWRNRVRTSRSRRPRTCDPASRKLVARIMPSMVDWPVP